MEKSEAIDMVCRVYESFYRHTSMSLDFKFTPGKQEQTIIDRLVVQFEKENITYGANYIIEYFEFQFNYWYKLDTRLGNGRVYLSWVAGKKAIQRWENKSEHHKYIAKQGIRSTVRPKVAKDVLRRKYSDFGFLTQIKEYEEKEKERFLNKPEGLEWCIVRTTLFNHKSPVCALCERKNECREILKLNYKKIFNLRGYE